MQPKSMAQFEDFAPTNRRHFVPQDQLGKDLAPIEDGRTLPVTLARSRAAHDGAEMAEDPTSFVSTSGKEMAAAQNGPMLSTTQAMQQGVSLEPKKRTGKKILGPPGQQQQQLFLGGSAAGLRSEPLSVLELGTTKQSPHVPGYTGHISRATKASDPAPQRSMDKSLVVENYKPYGAGYTGRKT
ncbi:hypothetical protein HYH03_005689 [Edaphochlamys debaryana]|uniref:Uncharacterized protein n=1 Tax=Edaphochlamys debaryana TaxID=47281 RepID=A0A835YC00_9CHLO|nr:hypothetical protein HYH03_005689 [Edaphochlamys debaryana]|eukprot:KAG2496085.1 hypothetical protein HYH03_005689 [Edaphochlamys debaryana]